MRCEKFEKLDILIDNASSWMWEHIGQTEEVCKQYSKNVRIFKHASEIENGDVMFILSCDRILKKDFLAFHKHNIIIHESDLPKGKGWSPMSWQVEAGINSIIITLFEAREQLDSGDWYLKSTLELDGSDLIDEIRRKQALKTIEMMESFLKMYPLKAKTQSGNETIYSKRTMLNQQLDKDKTIAEQFDKLRVCDNDRYPAHFVIERGGVTHRYMLKIYKW